MSSYLDNVIATLEGVNVKYQVYYLKDNRANGLVLDATYSNGNHEQASEYPNLIKEGDHIAHAIAVLLNNGFALKHISGTDNGNSYLFVKVSKIPFNSANKDLKDLKELEDLDKKI